MLRQIARILLVILPMIGHGAQATNVEISTIESNKFTYSCDSFQLTPTGTYQFSFCRTPTPPPPPATGDVGFMKGTWKVSPTHFVVDQSEPKGAGNITKVPGCANQRPQSISLGYCPASIDGFLFNEVGKILSVRYISKAPKYVEEYFQLSSEVGSGIPFGVTMSLSQQPGDFTPGNCTIQTKMNGQPRIYVHSTLVGSTAKVCPVERDRLYYLNIRQDTICTMNCTLKIIEPWSFM